jgi:integrase
MANLGNVHDIGARSSFEGVLNAHGEHTPGHLNCPACLRLMTLHTQMLTPSMSFGEASMGFLALNAAPNTQSRAQFVKPRTLIDLREHIGRLNIFFRDLKLEEIHFGHLLEYQRRRAVGEGFTRKLGKVIVSSPAGPNKIKQEMAQLIRIMKLAGCWQGALAQYYKPLQTIETDTEPALSYEEQERFLGIAASNPAWRTIWLYSLVARHTCFSSDELRTIRQGDINLTHQILGVNRRHGKNTYRRRDVPLSDGACSWALEQLLERAGGLVGNAPNLYLFPFGANRNCYDGERPMGRTGLRRQFEAVRKAAGVEWFNLNGWRHTAITRLAEAGVPIATIMARAGHMTWKMSAHYTHISEAVERRAMEQVYRGKPVVSIGSSLTYRQRKVG